MMVPKHIGIILDGNRRYAKARGMPSFKGHEEGAKTVKKLFDWAKELNIKELTLYTLSTENLKREKTELDYLFKLIKKLFSKFKDDKRIDKYKIKVRIIGKLSLLPKDVQKILEEVQKRTSMNNNYIINFCIAYGGRLELIEAIKKLKDKKEITEEDITNALWLSSEPDLIIRTGSVKRLSNFLPWQSVYSEFIFLDKMWPEFTKKDLIACIKEFENRKRNFGK
jgi:tritrans,polycis-undecaprenyl-diphosphate synthase [geranylgeranyl-diphosphate specific]